MWALLNEKSVPVRMSIVKDISNSALALDIYMWLAFRTNKSQPYGTKLSWKELNTQFEGDDYPVKEFKRRFKKALSKIQKVCPELKIRVDEAGVTVYPSLSSIRSAGYVNKTVTVAEKDMPNMGRVEKTDDTVSSFVGGTNGNTGFIDSLDTLSDIPNPFGE